LITYSTFQVTVKLIPLPWANWDALRNVAEVLTKINNWLSSHGLTNVKVVSYRILKDKNEIIFIVRKPNIVEEGIVSDLAMIALAISLVLLAFGFAVRSVVTSKTQLENSEIKAKAIQLYSQGKIDKETLNKIVNSTSHPSGSTISSIASAFEPVLVILLSFVIIEYLPKVVKWLTELLKTS